MSEHDAETNPNPSEPTEAPADDVGTQSEPAEDAPADAPSEDAPADAPADDET